ncbi:PH domain-containing protein [Planctomycetales bacterium ZRK34]|nr:PH domain-containing protein [Planctomycetales bacterium ZRK34]
MDNPFPILDLKSQAPAIERKLVGLTTSEKLTWLAQRGTVVPAETNRHPDVHIFESRLGFRCVFRIKGDKFVFFGDNATFVMEDMSDQLGDRSRDGKLIILRRSVIPLLLLWPIPLAGLCGPAMMLFLVWRSFFGPLPVEYGIGGLCMLLITGLVAAWTLWEYIWLIIAQTMSSRIAAGPDGIQYRERYIPWSDIIELNDTPLETGANPIERPYVTIRLKDGTSLRVPRGMCGIEELINRIRGHV